jgi:ABC-2 type transport system permease protein
VLIFLFCFGVFLPLQMGLDWVENPMVLFFWIWVPLLLVSSVVADSFAGERERHTLETLLASRLSDRAILFGKIAAAMGYGSGLSLISLVLGTLSVNLAHGKGSFIFYSPVMCAGILLWIFLGSGLAGCAGVLVSLRASTARQAQQALSISIMLLLFIPVFGLQALPADLKKQLLEKLTDFSVNDVVLTVSAVLLVLDLMLLRAAMAMFRRARLILD